MIKKRILIFITILFLSGTLTPAQTGKFRWESEGGFCQFEGTYNSKKFTAQQLKNTEKLTTNYFYLDFTKATVWKYEDIVALNFAPVEVDYQRKSAELKNLNIVKTPYWEQRKQQKLKELEQYYQLIKTTMESYKTPTVLRDYLFADSCQTKYAEPLIAGGESLLKVWETVNLQTRKNNADPARIKRLFEEQRASSDALKFAVVEVTAFGWWNCANALIQQGDDYETLNKNFRQLFSRIRTVRCEEP